MSILVGAGLLIQIWLVLVITNVLPGLSGTYSRSFAETLYGPTIPHLILLLAALVAVVLHAKHRSLDAFAFPILCLLFSCLTWIFGTASWRGGDDGPGMLWFAFLGGASLLNIVVGIPLLCIAQKYYPSEKSEK